MTAIVAHWVTADSNVGVYRHPIYHVVIVIFGRIAVLVGRNRSAHGSTHTGTDDRTLATPDLGADRTTQGTANSATNRRIAG